MDKTLIDYYRKKYNIGPPIPGINPNPKSGEVRVRVPLREERIYSWLRSGAGKRQGKRHAIPRKKRR
jgi:hypothetical protein